MHIFPLISVDVKTKRMREAEKGEDWIRERRNVILAYVILYLINFSFMHTSIPRALLF